MNKTTHLTPLQHQVTQEKATEQPFTGMYVDTTDPGVYRCVVCNTPLFDAETKFHSGTGWPSFYDVIQSDAVEIIDDYSLGMIRKEVVCTNCNAHLGHLFADGPEERTGKRYCINSAALTFEPSEQKNHIDR